jgi:hypothetical protein
MIDDKQCNQEKGIDHPIPPDLSLFGAAPQRGSFLVGWTYPFLSKEAQEAAS